MGRTFGTVNALVMAGIPLGAALPGFVVDGVGLVPSIVTVGPIYLVVIVGMFFNPALRRMDGGRQS